MKMRTLATSLRSASGDVASGSIAKKLCRGLPAEERTTQPGILALFHFPHPLEHVRTLFLVVVLLLRLCVLNLLLRVIRAAVVPSHEHELPLASAHRIRHGGYSGQRDQPQNKLAHTIPFVWCGELADVWCGELADV